MNGRFEKRGDVGIIWINNPPVNAIAAADHAAALRPVNSALDSAKFAAAFGYAPRDWKPAIDLTVAEIFRKQA